jgi:NADH dehydrogenase
MILVVGATGEVGLAVVRMLRASGDDVTALVRPSTDAALVSATGARIVRGDLMEPHSLRSVCDGVDVVIATASAIVPRRGEKANFEAIGSGYAALGRVAGDAGVRRFVFVSVPKDFMHRGAIEFDVKAQVEQELASAGPALTVVRPSLFMESWLPAVGSRLAIRGAEQATLDRGFWLTRAVGATTQQSIDRFGIAMLPGNGRARHSFMAVEDVAGAIAAIAQVNRATPEEVLLGGPEALSWREVVDVYAKVLGRKIHSVRQPVAPFRVLSKLARGRSDAAAHLLAVQSLVSTQDSICPAETATQLLGRPPVSVEAFLRRKFVT